MQNARVDALARICKGLETQLREVTVRHEGNLPQLDIAAQWRNHAYKVSSTIFFYLLSSSFPGDGPSKSYRSPSQRKNKQPSVRKRRSATVPSNSGTDQAATAHASFRQLNTH